MGADGSVDPEGMYPEDIELLQEYQFIRAFPGQTHQDFVDTPIYYREMLIRIHQIFRSKQSDGQGTDQGPATFGSGDDDDA